MDVVHFQRNLYQDYKTSIGFPEDRCFFHGNPIPVTIPVETQREGCMIVGASPKALRYEFRGEKDFPLESVHQPYSLAPYFDGRHVCYAEGSVELSQVLHMLGLQRQHCWITSLVKVFLFDSKDVSRYNSLGNYKVVPDVYHYASFAEKSMPWLEQEVSIAKPNLLILMGLETVGAFFHTSPTKAKHLIDGQERFLRFGRHQIPTLCLQEPHLLVTNNKRNPWPDVFNNRVMPEAMSWIHKLVQAA